MTHYRPIDITDMTPVTPGSQPAPQLLHLAVADLVIDDRYQRPLAAGNRAAIKRIAAEFQWSRFSPVLVAPAEGGKYAIIDGQHRAHAAALCGFAQIPAMVVMVAPEEQALAFIEINTRQIRVTGHMVYRAALTAGEPWAVQCRNAVQAADCQLMRLNNVGKDDKRAGQVFAIGLLRKLVEAGHATAVTEGLAALLAYDTNAPENFTDTLLTPFLWACATNQGNRETWLAALHHRKPWGVIEAADRMAATDGKPRAAMRREFFTLLLRKGVQA